MTYEEAIYALKYINLSRVHPFLSWEEMEEVRDMAIEALEEKAKTLSLTFELSEEQLSEWKKLIYGSEEDAKARELAYKTINEVLPKYKEEKRADKRQKMTNKQKIQWMDTEELAEYLFDRSAGNEYCYGICAYQDECDGYDHAQEFCIEQICKWLEGEVDVR